MAREFRFVTTEYRVAANVPRPLAFAFVSDLHGCPNGPILDAIAELSPDAILCGGDIIHNNGEWERGAEFYRLAPKIAPTFASLGNHEFYVDFDVRPLIRQSGAVLLDNAFADFADITVGALTSAYDPESGGKPNARFLARFAERSGFKLLLCHHPEYYERYIKPLAIDLTLSGHAHGGQWRFFDRGVFSPWQGLFPKRSGGAYDGGRLIVGRGLGNPVIIPRINNAPELVVVRIGGEKVDAPVDF